MKMKISASCFVIASLLAPVAGHATDTDSDRSRAGTYVSDSAITTKVKAKLAAEKMSSLTAINVDTDQDGVVYLSGETRTQEEADKAESIAKSTDGVKSVKNDIRVKKSSY